MRVLDRDKIPTVLFVSLVIIAIGMTGSTIDSVVGTAGNVTIDPQRGGGSAPNISADPNATGGGNISSGSEAIDLVFCIDILTTLPAQLGVLGGLGLIIFAIYSRYNLAAAFLHATWLVTLTTGAYFFLTNCITSGSDGGQLLSGANIVANPQGAIAAPTPDVPPFMIAVFFGGAIIAAIVLLITMTGSDESVTPIEEDEELDVETEAFARAAGRAADRIEEKNESVDNAVYQAWLEMTNLLQIENAETAAPRDFKAPAIAVGLAEDDVSELTQLFNEVRYGGKSADPREERAISVLRNIEETYRESVDEPGSDQETDVETGGEE
jgi:hypothetical protein